MKKKFILLSLSILIFATLIFARVETKPTVKPNIAPQKKTNCCSIQRAFKNKINLTEICIEKEQTKIEFQILTPYTMCANKDDIGLTDDNGKSYAITSMKNIPTCPETIQINQGYKFYWYFEKLEKGISTLDLTENKNQNLNPVFPNWEFWYWKDISVSKCNF